MVQSIAFANLKLEDESDDIDGGVSSPLRKASQIEVFYRFIYENNLRREAKILLGEIVGDMKKERKKELRKARGRKTKHTTVQ